MERVDQINQSREKPGYGTWRSRSRISCGVGMTMLTAALEPRIRVAVISGALNMCP